jgi:acyl carrier protein
LIGRPRDELVVELKRIVIGALVEILDVDAAEIDPDRSLGDMGVDSLLGLEFRKVIQTRCDIVLPATLVWNYPTVGAIASHIADRLVGESSGQSQREESAPVAPLHAKSQELASVAALSEEEALRALMGEG